MNRKHQTERSTCGKRKVPLLLMTIGAVAVVAVLAIWLSVPTPSSGTVDIVVYKTPACGCCDNWDAQLRDAGLTVRVIKVRSTLAIQSRVGMPRELASCHTAVVGDYWVEGHVPFLREG